MCDALLGHTINLIKKMEKTENSGKFEKIKKNRKKIGKIQKIFKKIIFPSRLEWILFSRIFPFSTLNPATMQRLFVNGMTGPS